MFYQQIIPPQALKPYIRYFWILKDDGAGAGPRTFKILPDGCPGMVFQENPEVFTDSDGQHTPGLFLYGQTTRPSKTMVSGKFCNIGIYFQPHVLKPVFGIDADELTDRAITPDLIPKNQSKNLEERLRTTHSPQKKIAILSEFVMNQLSVHRRSENDDVLYAVDRLLHQQYSLTRIQMELNISERSFQRLFKQNIGISPKLFTRIVRFQHTLNTIRNQDFSKLTDIAYMYHFADQSHYIREFKTFSGANPRSFLQRACEQVENFPEWKS